MEISLSPRDEKFLELLAKLEKKTPEAIIETHVAYRFFLLKDIRQKLIASALTAGYDKAWILNNLPGNSGAIASAYEQVKKDWDMLSREKVKSEQSGGEKDAKTA